MDHRIHLGQGQAVQPHGLDDLQALVHKGCAVDGDFWPHFPIGVLQGVCLGHMGQSFPVHAEEGTAGAGKQQAANLFPVRAAHKALKNGGMLGIHGDNLRAASFRLGHHQLPGADQGLLVGKADALLCPDGGEGGL